MGRLIPLPTRKEAPLPTTEEVMTLLGKLPGHKWERTRRRGSNVIDLTLIAPSGLEQPYVVTMFEQALPLKGPWNTGSFDSGESFMD